MEVKPYIFEPVNDSVMRDNKLAKPDNFAEAFAEERDAVLKNEEVLLTKKDIKAAEERGYRKGLEEGRSEVDAASMEVQKKVSVVLEEVGEKMDNLFASYDNSLRESSDNSVRLALKIAKKIAGEALKANPEEAVVSIVKQSINHLYGEPEVNISINPALIGSVEEKIKKVAKEKRFDGKIIFHEDANIAESDCLIDWKDGGAGISTKEIWQKIENIIEATDISLIEQEVPADEGKIVGQKASSTEGAEQPVVEESGETKQKDSAAETQKNKGEE